MEPLRNPRHEKFVKGLFEGLPASRAFEQAGYAPNDGNAIRLKGNEKVQARLQELQGEAAKKSEVTVQSLLDELEDARVRATSLNQLGDVVKSISEKAKISGLLTTKIEVTDNTGETLEDWVDAMLSGPGSPIEQFHAVDERDRKGLIDLVQRAASEISEYFGCAQSPPGLCRAGSSKKVTNRLAVIEAP
jgi:phage terminase small subunit